MTLKNKKSFDFFYQMPFIFFNKSQKYDLVLNISGYFNREKIGTMEYITICRVQIDSTKLNDRIIKSTAPEIYNIFKEKFNNSLTSIKTSIAYGLSNLVAGKEIYKTDLTSGN